MRSNIIIFISGLIFAVGLGLSGMTQPSKVIGFLDFIGNWDPSLMLVMAGAVGVYFISQRLILRRRAAPMYANKFQLPTRADIDWQLIAGAALFGVGWGLAGFCPGPAIVSLVSGNEFVIAFVVSMAAGMYVFGALDTRFTREPDSGAGAFERAMMVELEREDKAHHLP